MLCNEAEIKVVLLRVPGSVLKVGSKILLIDILFVVFDT